MAPATSTRAQSQTRSLNTGAKCVKINIISDGRVIISASKRSVFRFACLCHFSLPYCRAFVHQMDKVELRKYP